MGICIESPKDLMDSEQLSLRTTSSASTEEVQPQQQRKGKGQQTGRGKIEIKRIENATSRQVTFSKRRGGLLKKAHELSVLCDAQVALIIFSSTGKLFEFASTNMREILERYGKYPESVQSGNISGHNDSDYFSREVVRLKQQLERLQQSQRHLLGDDLAHLTLKDLQSLEQQLELGLSRIRTRKYALFMHQEQVLLDQIEDLHRRELQLHKENEMLRRKIADTQGSGNAALSINPLETREPPTMGNLSLSFPTRHQQVSQQRTQQSIQSDLQTSLQLGLYNDPSGGSSSSVRRSSPNEQ